MAERPTLDRKATGSIPVGGICPWTGTLNNGIQVLVAQWSAHASSKGKDDWFESIRAPPSLLSSVGRASDF